MTAKSSGREPRRGYASNAKTTCVTASLAAALLVFDTPANAEPEQLPRWDPGRHVTARVGPEVVAREASSDGVYGRFSGDLDFGVLAGAEFDRQSARSALRASVHYFSTAGAYVTFRDRLSDDASIRRVLSLGVDLRPAFIPRWSKNMQQGPSFLDLAIDSISLGMGAFWEQPTRGSLGDSRGFESSLGFGIPLFGRAGGPWLESRAQLAFRGLESAHAQFVLLLGFHALVVSPLVRSD
jgi:hypothetical protein